MIGTTLGHFRITAKLGEGGMGKVYRAEDNKLGREVAIKVLPGELAADPERLARSQREAEVLASLNHPNIAAIYGLEDADETIALVMELVEGPTLADRIAEGPVSVEETLPIARQIAEALAAAHEQNIVHRDLKPANVKVRPDGTVKVLDFGLAKATDPLSGMDASATRSPTLTLGNMTQAGMIIGTAAYMSPQQARGMVVDKQADIWAFGAVLYEMLTGQRAFPGSDVADTMATVIKSEPVWDALPPSTPRPLRRLLRRCLEKSPSRRLRDLGDANLELEDALTWRPELSTQPTAAPTPTKSRTIMAAVAAAAIALVAGLFLGRVQSGPTDPGGPTSPPLTTRTSVSIPDSAPLALSTRVPIKGFDSTVLALSPDGRHLVYVGQGDDDTRLYHRDLTSFADPLPIEGTDGAIHAAFSPDSTEIAFLTPDRVRKVALAGGAASTLCRTRTPVAVTWMGDTIYFTDREGMVLNRVSVEGGERERLFHTVKQFGIGGFVSAVLPGEQAALANIWSYESSSSSYAEIHVLPIDGAEYKSLGLVGFDARYLPSGHLIFARGRSVLSVAFDLDRLEVIGEPTIVFEDVSVESAFGHMHAVFASDGTVAYVPGGDLTSGRLAWVDRQGQGDVLEMPERPYGTFDVSPDERRIAIQVPDVRDYVWLWDVSAGQGREIAIQGSSGWPVWNPEGTALALAAFSISTRDRRLVVHEPQDGSTRELLSLDTLVQAHAWSASNKLGITDWGRGTSRVGVFDPESPDDIRWIEVPPDSDSEGYWGPALAPDASWIAYSSAEGTGRYQVWVQEVHGERRLQVSTHGGLEPVWNAARGEILYRRGNLVFASRITLEPDIQIGTPEVVFEATQFVDTPGISFDVSADGERLYYVRRTLPMHRDRIHLVRNWSAP